MPFRHGNLRLILGYKEEGWIEDMTNFVKIGLDRVKEDTMNVCYFLYSQVLL